MATNKHKDFKIINNTHDWEKPALLEYRAG